MLALAAVAAASLSLQLQAGRLRACASESSSHICAVVRPSSQVVDEPMLRELPPLRLHFVRQHDRLADVDVAAVAAASMLLRWRRDVRGARRLTAMSKLSASRVAKTRSTSRCGMKFERVLSRVGDSPND